MNEGNEETDRRTAAIEPLFYRREYRQNVVRAVCRAHPDSAPDYICPECCVAFCKRCVNVVSTAGAAACADCGALCRSYPEVKQKALSLLEQDSEFGLSDLMFALRYPMDLTSTPILAFCLLFALSFFVFPFIMAVGVLYHFAIFAVRDISAGNQRGFGETDFSSLLAEFFHPLLIGIAAIVVTLGPAAALTFGGLSSLKFLMPAAICWAIFYHPVAMLVAGTTDSFAATINPAAGFDLIRRMGRNCFMAFAYYTASLLPLPALAVLIPKDESLVILIFLAGLFCGAPIFYLNTVLACLFARAYYKSVE